MTELAGHTIDAASTALLLDIDGTLAPIVDDPEAAVVPESTLALVRRAVERMSLVAVVSGRSLEAARRLVPVPGIWLAASHGMVIEGPDGSIDVDAAAAAARPHLETALTLARTVGWRHEDKQYSLTIHFRHTASPEQSARQMRAQMMTVLDPRQLEIRDARAALEIRPAGARSKGEAVARLLEGASGVTTAIAVGDDRTDVDAFRALDGAGVDAVRVAVGSDEMPDELRDAADVVLESQARVEGLLASLVEG